MAAWVADADIIFLPCGFFHISSFFFPRLIAAVAEWMSTISYFYTWCGLSANLECRFEMCCMRLTGNTGRKNDAKNRHLGTIVQLCRAESLQLRHGPCPVSKRLAKQKFSTWGFPINPNEAEILFA